MMQQMGQQMQWNPQLAAQMNSAWQQHQQPPTSAAAHGQQKGQTASRPEVGPGGRTEVPGGPAVGQSGQALNQKTTPFQPPSGSTPGTTSSTTSLSREPDLNKGIFWQCLMIFVQFIMIFWQFLMIFWESLMIIGTNNDFSISLIVHFLMSFVTFSSTK